MPFHRTPTQLRYRTANFWVTYFIVGIIVLLLAFVYYTTRIVQQLDEAQRNQVPSLADLAAVIPSIKNVQLGMRLEKDFNILLENSRLSFIITDEQKIIKVRGIDDSIEAKIDSEPSIKLAKMEGQKLEAALTRMKKKSHDIPMEFGEDRELIGYFYHGDVDADKIDMLPFVIADLHENPIAWRRWGDYITADAANAQQIEQARRFIRAAQADNRVVPIQINPQFRVGHFYYDVATHYGLMLMPYIQIASITIFLAIGLFAYRRSKENEQAAIWGGLARETAHQLGTPISSLMVGVEMLAARNSPEEDEGIAQIHDKMHDDIERLRKITSRFGTIGAAPKRSLIDITNIIYEVTFYFQRRIPKQVELRALLEKVPKVLANEDLLQWVFENLIRNSLDALDKEHGLIEIYTNFDPKKNQVVITYQDNGKGIPKKERKKIFAPGYTTKKHGWGLGLTLVRRIIEEYHDGHIRLVDTSSEGTTFEIRLPVEKMAKPLREQ